MSEHKKSHEMPVTVEMLNKATDEVKSLITTSAIKIEALQSEASSLRTDMNTQGDSIRTEMKVQNQEMMSVLYKVLSKVEEIDNRNKFVLDGHAAITERQDRHEKEVDQRFKNIEDILSSKDH